MPRPMQVGLDRVRTRAGVAFAALLALFVLPECHSGSPAGTPCTDPADCASGLCLRGGTGSTCAQRCESSADCAGGDVCGRFDFRTVDGDSGTHTGDSTDVVYVCRARLTTPCTSNADCAGGTSICLGDPGVCSNPCSINAGCASAMCLPLTGGTCGVGACSPLCDDIRECPQQWYCDQSLVDTQGHGRCLPITGSDDAGAANDAACTADDAASDAATDGG